MFFTGNVADITEQDLLSLIGQVEEGERWEFKGRWPQNLAIEKTVCAQANTSGGYLLIGVDEENGTVVAVPGVASTPQHHEKIVGICGSIAPRVVPQVREVALSNGNVVVVVYTLPSPFVPHMCSDNKYYLRAGRRSDPMAESIVERLYLARRAQEIQANEVLRETGWGLQTCDAERSWWLGAFAIPLRLDEGLMTNSAEMLTLVRALGERSELHALSQAHDSYRGMEFRAEGKEAFELRHNGYLTVGNRVLWATEARPRGVYPLTFTRFVPRFLAVAASIYARLGYWSHVRLGLILAPMTGSSLLRPDGFPFSDEPLREERPRFEHDRLAATLGEEIAATAAWLLERVAQSYQLAVYELDRDAQPWFEDLEGQAQAMQLRGL